MNKNKWLAVFLGGAIILSIVFGGLKYRSDRRSVITVADPRAVGWAPFFVAMNNGYFERYGLIVKDVIVQTGDESLKAVLSDSSDLALAGIIPYSFVALDHPEMKIVNQVAYASDNQIVADKSKGISKPGDLRGKKIGYAKNTASEIGIEKLLVSLGLGKGDVDLINLKPLAMPAALSAGQIDAYSMWEPHISNGMKALETRGVVFGDAASTYTWHSAIIGNQKFIESKNTDLKSFMDAWRDAEDFMAANKDDAIKIVAVYTKLSPDVLEKIWPKYIFKLGVTEDTSSILQTDLVWANSHRESPIKDLPNPKNLITEVKNENKV